MQFGSVSVVPVEVRAGVAVAVPETFILGKEDLSIIVILHNMCKSFIHASFKCLDVIQLLFLRVLNHLQDKFIVSDVLNCVVRLNDCLLFILIKQFHALLQADRAKNKGLLLLLQLSRWAPRLFFHKDSGGRCRGRIRLNKCY